MGIANGRWRFARRWLGRLAIVAGVVLVGVGVIVGLDRAYPPDLSRLGDLSAVVADRQGRPLRVFLNAADAWRMKVLPGEVTPQYVSLLLAFEDKRFFHHWGVDPLAAVRALGQNLVHGGIVSGASTLTMQVARLLERRRRGWPAKIMESVRALQLEARFSKDDILAMYLTLAPYGGNLEGIRAASLAYFQKNPTHLNLPEAALLVALPRSPTRLRPDRDWRRATVARDHVLDRAVANGLLTADAAGDAKSEPVPRRRSALPTAAYHAADRLARRGGGPELRSSIDGDLQRAVADLARRQADGLDSRAGLAVVVVDHRTRDILAYVGAPDPGDSRRFGAIDMVTARRSPGSALKPFIYGMGFDDGFLHPETLISDVSTRFGDYAPQNFDRDFAGDLTVREALQRSLNVPAVLVLDRVGPFRFLDTLRRAGATFVLPRGAMPGLPVALGGGAINLLDLTMLYVAMAHDGMAAPLRLSLDDPPAPASRLLSAQSAHAVLRILAGAALPPGLVRVPDVRRSAAIAVKTGTSFGFRDAWAVGVSGRYVVGVWVGRPDGTPSPDRYGRNTAAPLVYAVFDRLTGDIPLSNDAPTDPGPAPLQRRIVAGAGGADRDAGPRLLFPTDGLVVDAPDPGQSLVFEASEGRHPLFWLVDGRRVAVTPIHRTVAWTPSGPGRTRVTVVDADGRADSVTFEVR